jgi:hypothetical protein
VDSALPARRRGDEAKGRGRGLDGRDPKPAIVKPRDMYEPDLHIDTLKVKERISGSSNPSYVKRPCFYAVPIHLPF